MCAASTGSRRRSTTAGADKLFEGGREAPAGKEERQGERELKKCVRELERALGGKTYELEIAGEALLGWE
jgi:transposase